MSEVNAELKERNIDLIQMNKELESFAYVSSHDLQEPLRKIQTFASRILENEFEVISEKGKVYFQKIQSSANRMQHLIEDLLTYSRISRKGGIVEKSDCNVVVQQVKDDLAEIIEARNAIIDAGNLCEIAIDPFLCRQVMNNLIGNAIKFSKPGMRPHIVIRSEVADGIIFNNKLLSSGKEYCHLSVSDSGIGFEPEFNERIFQLFQRLHHKDEYPGTGIGLAIVKKIIEDHNGIITASSEAEKGTTFDIYIPTGK